MFNPSQNDVRQFFCDVLRKHLGGLPLTPLEATAADWVAGHPEYHADLSDVNVALAAVFDASNGRSNPFLHLSMHLSITEQLSIDQPKGVVLAFKALQQRLGSAHAAHHEIMECLGEMMWASQQSGLPPDGQAYVECLQRRAGCVG
jgi:hypothetical protein